MTGDTADPSRTWRSCQEDLSDEEWELIADLVPTYSGPGKLGRPAKHDKRQVLNAIFYVAATGCQWRALPACYPNWTTVHSYHVRWSRDGVRHEALLDRAVMKGTPPSARRSGPTEAEGSLISGTGVRVASSPDEAGAGQDRQMAPCPASETGRCT